MIAELEQDILEALAPLRDVNIVVRGMRIRRVSLASRWLAMGI